LPLSSIKIDKIFIDPLPSDSIKDQQMLESIIAIAQAMQLGIVVEGVETQEQLLTISHHKNILIQGYLTGKPLSAKDAGQKIRQQMLY
jgi:EAL domain-containing protein (putative c-di-GMP-specific phosphodiesterase class I)